AAEAMTMLHSVRVNPNAQRFFVSNACHPQTLDVLRTRALPQGIDLVIDETTDFNPDSSYFGALLQYPGTDGAIIDYGKFISLVHQVGGKVAMATDLLALTLLKPPGEFGADVAIGSAQRFGVPLGYGGPHAGFFATKDELKRHMPGRLIGVSHDAQGKPAMRLSLQTREQHIRRDKATSNICTAQVLLAVMASMYAVYHGTKGLRAIAERVHLLASWLAVALFDLGHEVGSAPFFDTLQVKVSARMSAHELAQRAASRGINLRVIDAETLAVSLDETTTRADLADLLAVFAQAAFASEAPSVDTLDAQLGAANTFPAALERTSAYLTHHVFNRHHSETEMLRYLRSLSDKDLALDRSMIPLGSCTMKLNATSEMLPVTWPEFGQIHPFAPAGQTVGYREMIDQLEQMLVAATGYAAVSLQPNAGSQGEYAGLLIIHAYHASRGEGHRDVCLIPASAHGTNPASAQMAGMQVVVVACDAQGNVDIEDLKKKAAQHADKLAAIMITYPSTHGVFERNVREICEIVHAHGGQVYVDGANMNAMVGLTAPGQFGGDVSHLNLHKTFCIPHGGGGPGVGPVAVGAHLAQFLPNQTSTGYERDAHGIGAVSAAPYG
ncbi:MAG TPA: aminomethyl-transferring glycine dehydrogenase, partial [Paraburkholderia sp.]